VYSWNVASNTILTDRCIRDEGHTGECRDGSGHTWVRVGEWVRRAKVSA
jgi:hypothetical protein